LFVIANCVDPQASANANGDPNDVVAQVLNYTNFGNDQGDTYNGAHWFKVEKCVYKLHGLSWGGLKEIDLRELDPRLITFETIPGHGNYNSVTNTNYDNKILFVAVAVLLNISRLERGWGLIYSTYCQGKQKAF
jgi:hypothetical protein